MGNIVTQEDLELIKTINKYPELKARFSSILAIAQNTCEGCQTAHQVEDKVDKNLKLLGSELIHSWGNSIKERVRQKVKEEYPEYQLREKKIS